MIFVVKNDYMNIAEASEKWGLSARRIQDLCKLGMVGGAVRLSHAWMIPKGAPKPIDRRTRQVRENKAAENNNNLPMPRKAPFLDMTDLYTVPGSADECIRELADNPEAQALFAAEIAYSRGEIDKAYGHARYFLDNHSGMYAVISAGMLLALVAMWRGDVNLWREAKVHICEAPVKNNTDRDILSLSLACVNSAIRDLDDYPEWFTHGCFEDLPIDSHPAAKVFYIKYLLVFAQEMAKGEFKLPDVTGMGLMKSLPYIIEPMIVQAMVDKTVIPEIYLRLLCAIAYHQIGDEARATAHVDKAIALALPDGLLGILAEHRRQFDYLLDDRLRIADEAAFKRYKQLHKTLLDGWTRMHNSILDRNVSTSFTIRERQIARLAAYGCSNAEIGARLQLSESAAKKAVYDAMNKTGVNRREELGAFV